VISTSAAVTGPPGPPMLRANHSRSSGSPSMGGLPHAPGRRPARDSAAAIARSGCNDGCRYPPLNSITPGGGAESETSTPEASTERGTTSAAASALSASSCQEVSPTAAARVRGSARKAPAPGRVTTTSPSAASCARARETVTGLTRKRSTRLRLDGSFPPGE
jgi:hypothetical protein